MYARGAEERTRSSIAWRHLFEDNDHIIGFQKDKEGEFLPGSFSQFDWCTVGEVGACPRVSLGTSKPRFVSMDLEEPRTQTRERWRIAAAVGSLVDY